MPELLLVLLALPLGTAIAVALLGSGRAQAVRWLSLASTLASLLLATIIAIQFAIPRVQEPPAVATKGPMTFGAEWIKFKTQENLLPLHSTANGAVDSAIQFYVGIDGMNVWLILLTALLMVTSVLVSWTAVVERVNEFHAWLFVLQLGMTGVFASFDVILFYVFFELTLVPLFFLIGIWGGPQRQYAARKFFIYTLAGSLITVLGVIGVALVLPQIESDRDSSQSSRLTFSIPELVGKVDSLNRHLLDDVKQLEGAPGDMEAKSLQEARARLDYWRRVQMWVFFAMMIGFAVKVPMVPLHTWLPLAHVEAPTAGSVLLAGVLLKLGTYGFLRLGVPLAPDAALRYGVPLLGSLAVVGIIYGSFCALAQDDFKKLVAYSSVSHLGYCMLGLFALNEVGLTGSLMQMINHGLSTGGLFLLVGMLYERYHTRKMADYSGMGSRLHLLTVFMVIITMSSIGLPGLNGFLGEWLVISGMYDFGGTQVRGTLLAGLAAVGVLLGAWYMLTLVRQIFCGPLKEPHHDGHGVIGDLNGRELATLLPIAVLCLALGVYPKPFFDTVRPEIQVVAGIAERARQRAEASPTANADNARPPLRVAANQGEK